MALITAYRSEDGTKVRIPEHWLGHKVLGKPFRKTPPTKSAPSSGGGTDKNKEA